MWLSELAERSGLPVPTIKYYVRERLLHPGEAVGATRSRYDETHVRRLRLLRALTDVAGLRLDDARLVLDAVDDEDVSWHEALGSAHTRLAHPTADPGGEPETERVDALLRRHGWHLDEHSRHRSTLATALRSLSELDHAPSDETLDAYAEAAELVASRDVASLDETDRAAAVERAIVGTLLMEPVLLALRRIAQENASRRVGR